MASPGMSLVRRWRAVCRQAERGTVGKEAAIVVSVFFGVGAAVIVPFVVLYHDRMPRSDDGRALGARQAMGEDPVVFFVVIGTTLVAITISDLVFKRLRPRLVQKETARDVAAAAQAAARVLTTPAANPPGQQHDVAAAEQAATSYLMRLHRRRHWPYEADRVWVTVHPGEVEVVAERSFQKVAGLLWHWGSRRHADRMDVRGWVRVHADGTVTGQDVAAFEPAAR